MSIGSGIAATMQFIALVFDQSHARKGGVNETISKVINRPSPPASMSCKPDLGER